MNVHKKTILLSKKLVLMGAAASVMLLHSSSAFAATAPIIHLVRTITESGGETLFRDPLQMSLNPKTGELAVTNSGRGEVIILRLSDEKVLLRLNRKDVLAPPFGVVLKKNKSLLVGGLRGDSIRLFSPTGTLAATWKLAVPVGHAVRPGRIRMQKDGSLLVMDRENDQLLVLNPEGALQRILGKEKKLDQIQDAQMGPGNRLYVLCNSGQTVRVYDRGGKLLFGFGKHAGSPENFSFPTALQFDSRERLWVVDAFQHKLKVFTKTGDFLFQFGGIGFDAAQLFFPVDIAFDGQGRLFVLEKGSNRIKIYQVEERK